MESDLGKLFIGEISWDTDEERLKEYFSKYGEVVETVIMRDRTTRRARGFGFVVFADSVVAERVIMDKHMIDGRTVEAKKAVPRDDQQILKRNTSSIHSSPGPSRTRKIFVGGLASTIADSDFKKYFGKFGNITDVVVMYDHNTQRPRGFGFITYDSEDAVDRVLLKTFHELNGKMVEVKQAVPKELSPSPGRTPLIGYNYGLSRTNNFLNAYSQGYNMNSIGGFGMRMDSRFSPIGSGRSGFPPFSMNLGAGLSPNYGGGISPGYGRILDPYHSGNSNRYSTPIVYGMGNVRNDSGSSRNVWVNGNARNDSGAFLGSSFGVSHGNGGPNWGPGAASGYNNVNMSYGSGGRNGGSAPTSAFASLGGGGGGGYEGAYGESYRSSSVYGGDSTWRSTTPELDGSASFGYGLGNGNIASDVTAKSSEGYVGGYGRQSNGV